MTINVYNSKINLLGKESRKSRKTLIGEPCDTDSMTLNDVHSFWNV